MAIKGIIECITATMNLPMGITILTVLRTFGGFAKYGSPSSEE
jgi:hypothetical protein